MKYNFYFYDYSWLNNQNNEPTENQTPEDNITNEFIEAFNE